MRLLNEAQRGAVAVKAETVAPTSGRERCKFACFLGGHPYLVNGSERPVPQAAVARDHGASGPAAKVEAGAVSVGDAAGFRASARSL